MKKRRTKTSDARVLGVKVAISNAGSLRINLFCPPGDRAECGLAAQINAGHAEGLRISG